MYTFQGICSYPEQLLTFLQYWFVVKEVTLAPDGVSRKMLTINGTYPGPTIEADWGDNVGE